MANYYTQTSFCFTQTSLDYVASPLAAKWFTKKIKETLSDAGFTVEYQGDKVCIWTEESGDLDVLNETLQDYLVAQDPESSIIYTFAETCGKPRTDAFGGGAVKVTATDVQVVTTDDAFGKA